jgi:hypothetical protein
LEGRNWKEEIGRKKLEGRNWKEEIGDSKIYLQISNLFSCVKYRTKLIVNVI